MLLIWQKMITGNGGPNTWGLHQSKGDPFGMMASRWIGKMNQQQIDKMVTFARDVLGLEMVPWQVEAMRDMDMRDVKHRKRMPPYRSHREEMRYISFAISERDKEFIHWRNKHGQPYQRRNIH